MSLDTTKVGQVAAELMELIAESYREHENAKVQTVAIIVEVQGEHEDGTYTSIDWRCSDPRAWAQAGLFDWVAARIKATPPDR